MEHHSEVPIQERHIIIASMQLNRSGVLSHDVRARASDIWGPYRTGAGCADQAVGLAGCESGRVEVSRKGGNCVQETQRRS